MKPNAPASLARLSLILALVLAAPASGADAATPPEVRITAERRQVEVRHEGRPVGDRKSVV